MKTTFFSITTYIFVNLFLFSSWYFILFRNRHSLSFIDRLIGTFTLGLTQIVFTEMLLGVLFKKLFATPLFLLNISISSAILSLAVTLQRRKNRNNRKNEPVFKSLLLELKDEAQQSLRVIRKDRILRWVFRIFLISVLWIIFSGYLFPSYTWDSLWYHLPMVGYIMQSGAIQEFPIPPSAFVINVYPKNMELFFLWNTIFLKSDVIIDLSQLLFTIAGIFTIYSIAIKLGLKEEYAVYSSFLFFFTPVVILQSTTNYIDIAVAVLFLIAINFLTPHLSLRVPTIRDEAILKQTCNDNMPILLAGLSAGILLGSKGSGPIFVVVLLAAIMIRGFIRRLKPFSKHDTRCTIHDARPYLLYFILPVLLMGGYWYIKNWVVYGNPLYPMEISILDTTIFKGLISDFIDPLHPELKKLSPVIMLFYVWLERVQYYLYDSRLSGFGPAWFIMGLPSIVIAFICAIKEKRYNFLFVSAILIITFLVYPRNWNTRYVIFAVALGCLSFGLVLEYFKDRQGAIKIISLIMVIYTFLTANSPCIMPWKIAEFLKMPARERIIARHAPFNIDLQARQDYGLWIWVNNNMFEGNTLAYTFEPLFLAPLWNRSFSNKVIYVKSKNFSEWMEDLRYNQATHVLIRQNSTEDKNIEEFKRLIYNTPLWLGFSKNLAERFKVVYSDENYKVLKFGY